MERLITRSVLKLNLTAHMPCYMESNVRIKILDLNRSRNIQAKMHKSIKIKFCGHHGSKISINLFIKMLPSQTWPINAYIIFQIKIN